MYDTSLSDRAPPASQSYVLWQSFYFHSWFFYRFTVYRASKIAPMAYILRTLAYAGFTGVKACHFSRPVPPTFQVVLPFVLFTLITASRNFFHIIGSIIISFSLRILAFFFQKCPVSASQYQTLLMIISNFEEFWWIYALILRFTASQLVYRTRFAWYYMFSRWAYTFCWFLH